MRGGLLAAEAYLLRDDGMGEGGTTSRTSGISVMRIWLVDEDTALVNRHNLTTDSLSLTASGILILIFFNRLKQRR